MALNTHGESPAQTSMFGLDRNKHAILVVDDSPLICESFKIHLGNKNVEVLSAPNLKAAKNIMTSRSINLVILDIMLGSENGLDLLEWSKNAGYFPPVVVVSGFNDVPTLKKALAMGAKDYLLKPVDLDFFESKVSSYLPHCGMASASLPDIGKWAALGLVCKSQEMLAAMQVAEAAAKTNLNVFIVGESGTGKELFARAIHKFGGRAEKPYYAVNCGGMSESLFNAELFGYRKGAFTGADGDRRGFVKEADGGTLFLDEIGDVAMSNQIKLLRVVESGAFHPLGDTRVQVADVRYISATNRDLKSDILESRFRLDLFYRLKGFQIEIPPLRKRPEDIPVIAEHVFARNAEGKPPKNLTEEIAVLMMKYNWPGNVRQLENMLLVASALAGGGDLTLQHFPELLEWKNLGHPNWEKANEADLDGEVEKIKMALSAANGNVTKAADMLGINRATLYRKMKKHNFPR